MDVNRPGGNDLGAGRDRLFELAYEELRGIAGRFMSGERGDHTIQPTALVHEAYLRLQRRDRLACNDRRHFVALAATVMRHVLVDLARKRNADKRRGQRADFTVSSLAQTDVLAADDLLALHSALDRLETSSTNGSRHVRLVELVWLGGLAFTEAAEVLKITRRQAHRDWRWARTWLESELRDD